MNDWTLGVVIPVLNRHKMIIQAMDSVAGQTRLPDRFIIIDGQSTDGTPQAVEQWFQDHPNIHTQLFIQPPNAAAQRNFGAKQLPDCQLICFLDSDDLWPDDFLQRAVEAFSQTPNAVAATANLKIIDYARNRTRLNDVSRITDRTTEQLFLDPIAPPSATVFRYPPFMALGGFDPNWNVCEDWWLDLLLSMQGQWLYLPGTPVTRREHLHDQTGEAPQLSFHAPAHRHTQARMLQQFIDEHNQQAKIPEPIWRRRVGRSWYAAGRQYAKAGDRRQAHACFHRAIIAMPNHWRAQLRYRLGR